MTALARGQHRVARWPRLSRILSGQFARFILVNPLGGGGGGGARGEPDCYVRCVSSADAPLRPVSQRMR
jgi:hypothetical protein